MAYSQLVTFSSERFEMVSSNLAFGYPVSLNEERISLHACIVLRGIDILCKEYKVVVSAASCAILYPLNSCTLGYGLKRLSIDYMHMHTDLAASSTDPLLFGCSSAFCHGRLPASAVACS